MDWNGTLRLLREKERLTRTELGVLSGVGPGSIKAYELGSRHPSRHAIGRILDALKADYYTRNQVLRDAGFAPDGFTPSARRQDEYFDLAEACLEAARSPIPCCISTEVLEVVGANALVQRLWGVDLHREMKGPFERSMLSILSKPRIGDLIQNWDEAVGLTISIDKGHYGGEGALLPGNNPYIAAAFEDFLKGDQRYVQRFLGLWSRVQPQQRKLRFAYPIVMAHSRLGTLRFHVLVNPADDRGGLLFNDYVPLDPATASAVNALAEAEDDRRPFMASVDAGPPSSADTPAG
jgi:transcriptional regulator with XRE-family HTH domain